MTHNPEQSLRPSIRHLGTSYQKFCNAFEKFLPFIVLFSFIVGVFISGSPGVAESVYVGMDSFIQFYGLIAPLVIFIVLAPSLSRMASAGKGKRQDFISFAISWLSFRRFLSLIWAVLFTWVVFDLPFYGGGGMQNFVTSLKTTGNNLIYMCLTSTYFYAMYLAIASVFVAKKYKPFECFMHKLLRSVEKMGQYFIPFIPAFMCAIGVYVAQLDTHLSDQIVAGYDEQIKSLEAGIRTESVEAGLVNLKALRAKVGTETAAFKSFTVLGWSMDTRGKYGMVVTYILISVLIGIACMIWHFGLIMITKLKVKSFSIKEYFTKYWIRVYPLLWATSSEALAMPLNLYLVKRYYPNIRSRVRHFTIGVGSYLSINGTMICVIVLAGAVANILGIELTAIQLFLAIPLVFLIGFGVPGIPGELLLFAGPLLQVLDIPPEVSPTFLALYLGLQIGLPDSFRTGNNSTDDCVLSILLNNEFERKFYNEDIFVGDLLEDVSFRRLFASHVIDRLSPQFMIFTNVDSSSGRL